MATFSEANRQIIQERLAGMVNPVRLVHFTQTFDCELCKETGEMLEDLVALTDKLSLEVYNFPLEQEKAAQYGVDKVPATVVEGAKNYGVRVYGLPAGFEFAVLLETMLRISEGKSGLEAETIEKLKKLKTPVRLEVFVTPTCPYCPGAARLAHQLAMESELISADMIEATEFPELVRRYAVRGVPKTVINGVSAIEGSLPEEEFVDEILAAAAGAEAAAAKH